MAGISLNYNGVDLSQWFDVTDVQRNLGTNHANTMEKVGRTDGQLWQYMSRDTKTITVNGIVANANLANLRRDLGAALDVDKPEQLIIGDDTGVYYLAIYDGQPTIAEDWRSGTISLSFIVPDGIAHSVSTQTANNMPYKDVPVNLLTGTSDQVVQANNWNMQVADIKYDKSLGGALCASVMINNADHASVLLRGSAYIVLEDLDKSGNVLATANGNSVAYNANGLSWCSISIDDNTADVQAYILTNNMNQNAFYSCLKIEKGTTTSPWSPNPADPEYYTDTINFTNKGSYKSYPLIELTMGGDNGYIGLASSSGGYLEFGNSNEIDGVQAASTETVFHWDMLSAPSQTTVNSGKINYVTYPYGSNPGPNTIAGSWDYAKAPDAATPVLNRTSSMHWAGPTIHGSIPANAAGVNTGNFYCANRMNIATSKTAVGRAEINLQSGNDIVVSFVIRDSSNTADTLLVEGWAKGTNFFAQNLDRRKFTNGAYNFEIKKAGDKLTFIISKIASISSAGIKNSAQILFPFTIEGLADTPVDSITGWMAGFSNWNGWTANWSDSLFQWVNVDYWQDLPNRWTSGDVVMVDCINKRVLVNGVEDPTLQTIGNHWDEFCIDPGENIIDVSASNWATLPKVKINWKEAFV